MGSRKEEVDIMKKLRIVDNNNIDIDREAKLPLKVTVTSPR